MKWKVRCGCSRADVGKGGYCSEEQIGVKRSARALRAERAKSFPSGPASEPRHRNPPPLWPKISWSVAMSWKPLILCVDDTPSMLEGLKMLLEGNGYRVLTATNGKEAVQVFTSHSVDLVLLDYYMPEMNGGMTAVRMKDSKPDVPVALFSSDECLPVRELEGVDCFIPKSEPIVSLLEKVDYLLSLRFLFQPFDASKAQDTRDHVDTHEGGPEADRPNGISKQNERHP